MGSAFVDSDHDVGSLDHGVGGLATFQLEIVHRFVGDRCGHNRSADIDAHMGRRLTLLHGVDGALQNISRTELHRNPLWLGLRKVGLLECVEIALYSLTT